MLRYLNEILTGNEESRVVDLWILFIVCYWSFQLFLAPANCKDFKRKVFEQSTEKNHVIESKKLFRVPVPRSETRMKTHPSEERAHSHGHVVPARINQSLASPSYTPTARRGTSWQMQRLQTTTRVPFIQVTRAVKFKICELAKSCPRYAGNPDLCISMIAHYGVDINEPLLPNGMTIFHCCCLSNSYKLISAVISMGNMTQCTYHGDTPLYLATVCASRNFSSKGLRPDLRILELLVHEEEVNRANLGGFTPLHQASKHGCEAIVSFLLERGADPYIKTVDENKAVDFSVAFGHTRLTQLLNETSSQRNVSQILAGV